MATSPDVVYTQIEVYSLLWNVGNTTDSASSYTTALTGSAGATWYISTTVTDFLADPASQMFRTSYAITDPSPEFTLTASSAPPTTLAITTSASTAPPTVPTTTSSIIPSPTPKPSHTGLSEDTKIGIGVGVGLGFGGIVAAAAILGFLWRQRRRARPTAEVPKEPMTGNSPAHTPVYQLN